MTDIVLSARTAYQGLSVPASAQGRGVVFEERTGFGLATLIVRRNARSVLVERIRQRTGVELPIGPRLAVAPGIRFAGIGVGTWWVLLDRGAPDFAMTLKDAVGDAASVVDQSDGYGIVRVSGSHARDALCKLVPVDLHPSAFKVGDVATTFAGHVGVTLWRLEHERSLPVFEVAAPRSMAESFWRSLVHSAAEFGIAAIPAR
jgi:sarcosine oxidase subunit gamma